MDKIMRMHSVTSTIENGFVHLPDKAPWLGEYLHEVAGFPRAKYDDQVDSTSQALAWIKEQSMNSQYGLLAYYRRVAEKEMTSTPSYSRRDALREYDERRFRFGRS
jgi:hypothetical protein